MQWQEFFNSSEAWPQIKAWLRSRRNQLLESRAPMETPGRFALLTADSQGKASFIKDELLNEDYLKEQLVNHE